jgi:Zn-dependent protease
MFNLFRVFDIQIKADWTILFLIFWANGSFAYFAALVLTIILHELGHALIVRSRGGHVEGIILQGFGGMTLWSGSLTQLEQACVALGGPLVNIATALLLPMMFPMAMGNSPFTSALVLWGMVLGIFNLLPILPLDGGHVLQRLASHKSNTHQGRILALQMTRFFAGALGIYVFLCWMNRSPVFGLPLDPFFLVVIFGLFFYLAHRELGVLGAYSSGAMLWRNFMQGREEKKKEKKEEMDLAMRARVDQLLAKISREGMNSLSSDEREFLKKASDRFK